MKVVRKPLIIRSEEYSREHGIPRSLGCHVSQVIERIVAREEKKSYDRFEDTELENLRAVGFMFERAMCASAKVVELERNDGSHEIEFPGEMFWCYQCDEVMPGGDVAARHCKKRKHKGVFFTPDGIVRLPLRPIEWKYTHLSSRRTGEDHIDGMPKWKHQTRWYDFGLESTRSRMEVVFARGDYSTHKPMVQGFEFEIEYTRREIEANKFAIISNARAEGLL